MLVGCSPSHQQQQQLDRACLWALESLIQESTVAQIHPPPAQLTKPAQHTCTRPLADEFKQSCAQPPHPDRGRQGQGRV